MSGFRALLLPLLIAGCGSAPGRPAGPPPPAVVTISVVGTTDLHGNVLPDSKGHGGLALFGGYLANLRAARAADGGVVVVDGGDLFQGTMESNLNEGAAVVVIYNLLGYDATAIGNHEFDFGPAGPRTNPGPGDDARGALRARAAEARFPFLTSNVIEKSTGKPLGGKNIAASTMREVAGVKIGIVGAATADTPHATAAAVFAGLDLAPLAERIDGETRRLRAAGAELVVLTAHAGLCAKVKDITDVQRCDGGEIYDVVGALKEPVDVVVAGHSHVGSYSTVGTTPIMQAWRYGYGFGRVDIVYDRTKKTKVSVSEPQLQDLAPGGSYEGAPVAPDPKVEAALAPYVAAAANRRHEKLGVTALTPVARAYGAESQLGNLATDLMRVARPGADVALTNGGGLRKDLPAGELTYGDLFEAFPFDNTFATVKMTGAELATLMKKNLESDRGILSLSGMRAVASCNGNELLVKLTRENGKPVRDDEMLTVLTSDFLATGGMEGVVTLDATRVNVDTGETVRDGMVGALRKRGGSIDPPTLMDKNRPRLAFPGKRPVTCP